MTDRLDDNALAAYDVWAAALAHIGHDRVSRDAIAALTAEVRALQAERHKLAREVMQANALRERAQTERREAEARARAAEAQRNLLAMRISTAIGLGRTRDVAAAWSYLEREVEPVVMEQEAAL